MSKPSNRIINSGRQPMASRIEHHPSKDTVVPLELIKSTPTQYKSSEEEIEKKALQTIYTQLKQVRLWLSKTIRGKHCFDRFYHYGNRRHAVETKMERKLDGKVLKITSKDCNIEEIKKESSKNWMMIIIMHPFIMLFYQITIFLVKNYSEMSTNAVRMESLYLLKVLVFFLLLRC